MGGEPWPEGELAPLARLEGEHECSGVLVAPGWLLTAAHCEDSAEVAYLGQARRGDSGAPREVVEFVPHPDYLPGRWSHDLGLARISPPAFDRDTPGLSPSSPPVGPYRGFHGLWGRYSGPLDALVTVPMRGRVEEIVACPEPFDRPGNLCWRSASTAACGGDSGSPVWSAHGEVVAVQAFGYRGCPVGYPQGATRVDFFIDWIRETVAGDLVGELEWPEPEVSGVALFGGWAFSGEGVALSPVEIWIDGEYAIDAPLGGSRGDVERVFPDAGSWAGFGAVYNFDLLPPGAHVAEARVLSGRGDELRARRPFSVCAGPCPPLPTPRPRPHIPVLYREGGFTPPELYDAIEAADAWMYSRNIGVLSRCVSFTLGEWEKEISPRGEVMERSRVYGEIEEFTEFLRHEFPEWAGYLGVEDPPYTYIKGYD